MEDIQYIHVRYPDGTDDMVPESTAHVRAQAGDFTIVDPTPGRWRAFKPRMPLGTRNIDTPLPPGGDNKPEEGKK